MSEQQAHQEDRPPAGSPSLEEQAERKPRSVIGELCGFLWAYKAWWLLPIIIALLLVAGLILLGGTAAAPFIYTLF